MNDVTYDPEILQIEQDIYQRLNDLNIGFETFNHASLFTVEQALEVMDEIAGAHVKNLFLRDKKKNFFLITAYHQTDIDLKTLRHKINASGNLSFASADDLWAQLKIRPGSVNPLVLISVATTANIRFFIDKKLTEAESVNLHPMRNDKSITLKSEDLMVFLTGSGHDINLFDFASQQ